MAMLQIDSSLNILLTMYYFLQRATFQKMVQ